MIKQKGGTDEKENKRYDHLDFFWDDDYFLCPASPKYL